MGHKDSCPRDMSPVPKVRSRSVTSAVCVDCEKQSNVSAPRRGVGAEPGLSVRGHKTLKLGVAKKPQVAGIPFRTGYSGSGQLRQ
mmetsp:Transcript_49159/g.76691  ORF Transcript_49159/g.76691 Transcript_49159/m.76691 type:complete len:85 (+) Transcript_49159:1206-1460(+)